VQRKKKSAGGKPALGTATTTSKRQATAKRQAVQPPRSKGDAAIAKVLRDRGIPIALAKKLALEYMTAEQIVERTGYPVECTGILIPFFDVNGKRTDFYRIKLLGEYVPQTKISDFHKNGKKQKPRKYLQPEGSSNHLYFPPLLNWGAIAKDTKQPIFCTEGELKAIAMAARGFNFFATTGVNSWRTKDEDDESSPVGELNLITWAGRDLYIFYDADAAWKQQVQRAQLSLAHELFRRGAAPYIGRLPHIAKLEKTGIDDWWLARGPKAAKEFALLVAQAESPYHAKTTTTVEMDAMVFKDPVFIVNGLLTPGLNLLAGPIKGGKSFMALALVQAVAVGGKALGMFSAKQGDALYISLEDGGLGRTDRRRKQMKLPSSPHLHIVAKWPKGVPDNEDAATEALIRWCEQHPKARLIIIDTLQKFRRATDARKKAGAYEVDYAELSAIKAVADRFGIAILVLHHLKKGEADDVFERASGTSAITGVPDTVMVLLRERDQTDGFISVTGRDIPEQELALSLDLETGLWKWVGEGTAYRATKIQKQVITAIKEAGKPLSPKDIAGVMGKKSSDAVRHALARMVNSGLLTHNAADMVYGLPEPSAQQEKF
jgi:hypothetical protein